MEYWYNRSFVYCRFNVYRRTDFEDGTPVLYMSMKMYSVFRIEAMLTDDQDTFMYGSD